MASLLPLIREACTSIKKEFVIPGVRSTEGFPFPKYTPDSSENINSLLRQQLSTPLEHANCDRRAHVERLNLACHRYVHA